MTQLEVRRISPEILDVLRNSIEQILSDGSRLDKKSILSKLSENQVIVGDQSKYKPYIEATLTSLYVAGKVDLKNNLYSKIGETGSKNE